jgi:AraC-like DNA-binding protein
MIRPRLKHDEYHYADQVPVSLPLWLSEIGCSRWRRGAGVSRMGSSIIAIEQVLSGSVSLVQSGRTVTIHAGELYILKRDCDQEYRATSAIMRKQFIGLGGPLAHDLTAALPDLVAPRDAKLVRTIFQRIRQQFRVRGSGWQVTCASLAYQLLAELTLSADAKASTPALHPMIEAAVRYLTLHHGRPVGLGELARAAHASPAHLNRLFRATFHMSPLRYARCRVMEQAKHLLAHSRMSCRDIAHGLGYQQPLYFSSVFRRMCGSSPSAYRRRHQG